MQVLGAQSCLFATPGTVACQLPLCMGFSRQERWIGLPFPSPEGLSNPGIKPRSPALQADSLPSEPPGKPRFIIEKGYGLKSAKARSTQDEFQEGSKPTTLSHIVFSLRKQDAWLSQHQCVTICPKYCQPVKLTGASVFLSRLCYTDRPDWSITCAVDLRC